MTLSSTNPGSSKVSLRPNGREWRSHEVLSKISSGLAASEESERVLRRSRPRHTVQSLLWHEICSEYDARRLSECLLANIKDLSPEFLAFQKCWLADESNHFDGFSIIYSALFGGTPESIVEGIQGRPIDLTRLDFINDEFSVCVLLAYDELVTAQAFKVEFPIYDLLNSAGVSEWIRLVQSDEIYHGVGAVKVILKNHSHRLGDVSSLLDRIALFDSDQETYGGAFVLDHQGVEMAFITKAKKSVLKACKIWNQVSTPYATESTTL
jgi:hypothetical protein